MKKFGVINYCDDASDIPGLVGDLKDTPEEGMAEALRRAEYYCDDEECSKELIEPGDGKYSVDNCGCTHSFDMVEIDLNLTNLQELMMLLLKHRFEFRVEPVTQKMDFTDPDGKTHAVTNRIEIFDRRVPRSVLVFTCDGLDALVDLKSKETQVMDAQEVTIWALNELRDQETPYGKA